MEGKGVCPTLRVYSWLPSFKFILSKINRTMNRLGDWARLYEIYNFRNGFFLVVSRHYKINGDTQVTNHSKSPYAVAMSRQK